MIVYIASYPRSGNLWVRSLITNQFKRLTSRIHGKVRTGNKLANWIRSEAKLYNVTITTEGAAKELPVNAPDVLKGRMVAYDFEGGTTLSHRALIPGLIDILNEDVRKYLAEDDETYFIKSHFPLPERTFPGEYVIQVIRHPGATLWSYYKFLHDLRGMHDVTLESVLLGKHGFGDWSEYHAKFKAVEPQLGKRLLLVRYEELSRSEAEVCERMSQFLRLPIVDREFKPFEFYQKHRKVARSGTVSGWERNFSRAEWDLLSERHGKMMREMGYSMPEFPASTDGSN